MAHCVLKMQQACAVPGILCSAAASSSALYNNSCTSSSPQLLSLSACCNRATPATTTTTTTTTGGVKQQAWRLASSSSSSQIQGTCIIVVSQTIKLHTRRRCILSGRVLVPGFLLPSPRMRGTVCVYAEELKKGRHTERERERERERETRGL
jgi:hypothetical protein